MYTLHNDDGICKIASPVFCTMMTVFVRLLHPCFVFLLITQNRIHYNKLHLKDEDVQVWCLKTEIKGIALMQAIDIFTEDVQVWCLKTEIKGIALMQAIDSLTFILGVMLVII